MALLSDSLATMGILPPGSLVDFAGSTAPSGWLMCDGTAISRTTYASLFVAIGTSYGVGDGSITFNVPDFRGRFARYNDNMGVGAAGRDTGRAHGSAQAQATAKNGLSNATSSISGTANAGVNLSHNHSITDPGYGTPGASNISASAGGTGYYVRGGNTLTIGSSASLDHSHGVSGTASAQTITGDSETRPINLSCYKIIKI